MKENKKNNGKRSLALLISIVALFVFAGSLLAYFSDQVKGDAKITAGTLDIDGKYQLYDKDGNLLPSNTLTNFNPGDVIYVKATMKNYGTKSAWIRNGLTISGELTKITYGSPATPVVKVYEGEVKDFTQSGLTLLTFDPNGAYTSKIDKISGSVEIDGPSDEYSVVYTILFAPEAKNDAQDKAIDFTFITEALQLRNNNEGRLPTNAGWQNIETTSIKTP
ncbi:hypothetical protein AOC36_09245 [Erysipelothrix larvae]|uniref:SipW-cognate class signal peptide n=1 Tax=Erysipelothrix larvae TaxID=1514105 RepID=A0A0X8H142_9FIRM|nr:TasA family protein [Erysipelothrix larvae]AMC94167.1 hypothetical protein AOC36_09245 [Erysipelothrix larvae]